MVLLNIAEIFNGSPVTREDGARIRHAIEEHWEDPEPVTLDFGDGRIASISFFDESLGLLAESHSLEDLRSRVRIERILESDRALLNRILNDRARKRASNAVVATGAVADLLLAAGVPAEIVKAWDGKLLALYQDHSGLSASLEVARETARQKSAAGGWTLDLGSYATGLARDVGSKLKAELDDLGIAYASRSMKSEWAQVRGRTGLGNQVR
jgi:hypothetical protein